MEQFISIVVTIAAIYLLLGALFTILFLWKGITKVDDLTADTSFAFKLLIFPGLVAMWPMFLSKWIKANRV